MILALDASDMEAGAAVLVAFTLPLMRQSVARTAEDIPQLEQLVRDSLRHWSGMKDRGFAAKYMEGQELAGYIIVQHHWNLSHLFVRLDLQGQGIGRALVETAIACCRRGGGGRLRLNASFAGRGFYEHLGFLPDGAEKQRPGGCIPMTLTIAGEQPQKW